MGRPLRVVPAAPPGHAARLARVDVGRAEPRVHERPRPARRLARRRGRDRTAPAANIPRRPARLGRRRRRRGVDPRDVRQLRAREPGQPGPVRFAAATAGGRAPHRCRGHRRQLDAAGAAGSAALAGQRRRAPARRARRADDPRHDGGRRALRPRPLPHAGQLAGLPRSRGHRAPPASERHRHQGRVCQGAGRGRRRDPRRVRRLAALARHASTAPTRPNPPTSWRPSTPTASPVRRWSSSVAC